MYTISIIFVSLILLIFIIAAIAPKSYVVTRKAMFSNTPEAVFDYVRRLLLQENYSKWVMTDPDKKITTKGTDGEVGFIYAWDGNKQAGAGEQEILTVTPSGFLETEVRFIRPFKGLANITMELKSLAPNTELTWTFKSAMPYPMNIMLLFLNMEKMLGNDMEFSLQNLKKILDR